MKLFYYLIETPEVCFSFIGGKAQPDGNFVTLHAPNGQQSFRLPKSQVTETTREEITRRIIADKQARDRQSN
jgi:hypothetical protein